jgi:hypothetical protein
VTARPASESVLEAFIGGVREAEANTIDEGLVRLWGRAMRRWSLGMAAANAYHGSGMVDAYGDVIAGRMGVPTDDVRVEVMATAIAGVMWSTFLRWLGSDGSRPLTAVVEEAFTVLGDLNLASETPPP